MHVENEIIPWTKPAPPALAARPVPDPTFPDPPHGLSMLHPIRPPRKIVQLTWADLEYWLAQPHRQELIVRVVGGRMLDGDGMVTLLPVEWHAQCGPFEIAVKDVVDLGLVLKGVFPPIRWRDEFVGCHRVRVPWEAWARHLNPGAWAGK